jgi:sugar-specific transcriptional regulator TrmB
LLPEAAEHLLQANPRLLKALSLAGLSKRDLTAYILLLTRGPLTAAQLAREMNIPLTKAYLTASRLTKTGLASSRGRRPATYVAAPPREAWLRLKSRLLEEISYVEEKLIPALETMASNAAAYNVFVLGPDSIENTARQIVLRGVSPLRVAVAFKEMAAPGIIEVLRETSHRRSTRILVAEEARGPWIEELEGAEIRYTENMFGGGFIGEEVLLVIRGGRGLSGLWSSHEYFVSIATIYFDHLWSTASNNPTSFKENNG